VSIDSLFWPESVAIVGASTNPRSPGGKLFEVLRQYGFEGRLYAINPKGGEVAPGVTAYVDLRALPEVPDLCLVVVAVERVNDVLEECRGIGVKAALVYSSSDSETITYDEIRRGILDATKEKKLRVVGPNSVGFFNNANGLAASWSPVIDLQQGAAKPLNGPLVIVAQSGGLGFGLLGEATRRGVGVRYVVSTGNEADVTSTEVMHYALNDDSVSVVLLFLEGLDDPFDLVAIGDEAHEKGKSIVVAKVGRSIAGQEASALHTAHLAGSDVAYEAVFQQFGFARADDTEEMIDYGMALSRCPTMSGRNVGIATLSGGAGVWVSDACSAAGLTVPALESERQDQLRTLVATYGSTRNPVDLTGPSLSATALIDAATMLAEESTIDSVVVIMPMLSQRTGARLMKADSDQLTADLGELQRRTEKPILMFSYAGVNEFWLEDLSNAGLAWYTSPVRLARSLRCLADHGSHSVRRHGTVAEVLRADVGDLPLPRSGESKILPEHEVKQLLSSAGIRTTRATLAHSASEAEEWFAQLGVRAVAMKAQVVGVVHKAEAGLVALAIRSAQVSSTYDELWNHSVTTLGIEPNGILIEEMVSPGLEMIVGTITDPDFGPLVMVGAGGAQTEQIGDRRFRLAPADIAEVTVAIEELALFRTIEGMSKRDQYDWDALAQLVVSVSAFAWRHRGQLASLELNPVVMLPRGQGVIVVDGVGEAFA
jgi:acetate---CoA ligase (ADP-forming)